MSDEKTKCKNCGNEVEGNPKHCPECGVKLRNTVGDQIMEKLTKVEKDVEDIKKKDEERTKKRKEKDSDWF